MNQFESISRGLFADESLLKSESSCFSESSQKAMNAASSIPSKVPDEYEYQAAIRPAFGKPGLNKVGLGAHPDFVQLENCTRTENHYICTLFVDIKRSSRLNILLSLEQAFVVKNRILQAAIDVVRSLDGVPHRLMGDALMAFFGGKYICKEDAIANAVNAAAMLRFILYDYVFPNLNDYLSTDIDLAVRVGLDFGDDNQVLWACYGFGDATEITAQGLQVDFASKLQSMASSNTAMMGQGILGFIDFPELYSEVKTKGDKQEQYVRPNITDKNGSPINYICKVLKSDDYQRLLPFPPEIKQGRRQLSRIKPNPSFSYWCEVCEDGDWLKYPSLSRFLDKGRGLRFTVEVPSRIVSAMNGITVDFYKHNHGQEARRKEEDQEHLSGSKTIAPLKNVKTRGGIQFQEVSIPECTAFRGLHTMMVKAYPSRERNTLLFQDWIGVYIL